ncbi:hypothetical protein B1R94_02330 [Mycolicibacterium litorale]|nr:hypothetical protein B1R94_02330 [Mycolicibacterium litorale]
MAYTWPIDRTCLPDLPVVPPLPDNPTDEQLAEHDSAQASYDAALARRDAAEDLAVSVLWALSGRQFGVTETTVRPCPVYARGFGYRPWMLLREFGHWVDWPCGCGINRCTVAGPRVIHLPGPTQPDTEDTPIVVTVAGVELDHDAYILEGDALYRAGGNIWPAQDLGRPLGEPGTWSVSYHRGNPAPPSVAPLVGALAQEFMLACSDGSSDEARCRLPRTLRSTTRKGATNVFDPAAILANGKTGLPEVDLWLAAVNPSNLKQDTVVL